MLGLIFFLLTLTLFIDIYEKFGTVHVNHVLYLQFIPSLLQFVQTLSLATAGGFIIILILTLLLGRLYCSTICPLGIIQDFSTWLSKKFRREKSGHKFSRALRTWRYSFLFIMLIAIVGGFGFVMAWLDPFSIAGRFFTYIANPLFIEGNNMAASFLHEHDIFVLFHVLPGATSWLALGLTLALFITIVLLAWYRGRFFCNVVCPVGTLLGLTSRASLLKVKLNPDNCTQCGDCASVCKSECINIEEQSVDTSRCVTCFNCLQSCHDSAIELKLSKPAKLKSTFQKSNESDAKGRREMIVTLMTLAVGTRLYALKRNRMGENNQGLVVNRRDFFPIPPGSGGVERFNTLCTACSLCISACPERVLYPSVTQHGLSGFMQPFMDYSKGFCGFDCNRCGSVCPTGAILPLPLEEKQRVKIGTANYVLKNCVVSVDGFNCGDCADLCPTGAIKMVPFKEDLSIPEVNPATCIGCGACEHGCPVQPPYRAIFVNGHQVHGEVKMGFN